MSGAPPTSEAQAAPAGPAPATGPVPTASGSGSADSTDIDLSSRAASREKIDVYNMNYVDRHIVKHLRHMVEKDLEKKAWAHCDEFSKVLLRCQQCM